MTVIGAGGTYVDFFFGEMGDTIVSLFSVFVVSFLTLLGLSFVSGVTLGIEGLSETLGEVSEWSFGGFFGSLGDGKKSRVGDVALGTFVDSYIAQNVLV
jgi:hypothetical protein